jgi:hypothetical protein
LIRDEDEESALPPEYEPLLVPEDGQLRPADLVEDELVLAVPVVALSPDSDAVERDWTAPQQETEAGQPVRGVGGAEETIAARAVRRRRLLPGSAKVTRRGRLQKASCRNTIPRPDKIEPSLEQSHGCPEIPCHPVPPRPASCPRRPERQAAVDRPDHRRSASASPRHCRRFLPRQEGHPTKTSAVEED